MKKIAPPPHLSFEATQFYNQPIPDLPCIDFTSVAQVQMLRETYTPIWQSLCEQIPAPYHFEELSLGKINAYLVKAPEQISDSHLILYLHGGSYIFGHPTLCKNIPVSIAQHSGINVLSLEYPLAPEALFPAPHELILTAIEGLSDYFPNLTDYALVGHSAGGGLALSIAQQACKRKLKTPAALALIAPWVDVTLSGDSMTTLAPSDPNPPSYEWFYQSANAFLGNLRRDDPLVSPLFADMQQLCPTYIQQPGRDRLLSDATRLNRRLLDAGVISTLDIWDGLWHGFQMFPLLPEAKAANQATANFITRTLLSSHS